MKTTKRNLLSALLLLVAMALGQNAMAQWTGAGTQQNPYQIKSIADLNTLATNVNSGTNYNGYYFELTTDLTYSYTYAWNSTDYYASENNFTAIGAYGNSFKGHFDGGGHTISGIRIYKSGTTNADQLQGVFGNLSGGSVRNLTVADASITGYQQVGAIAGCNNGTIEDCVVASNVGIYRVADNASKHGGIVGANSNGNVRRCTSSATVKSHPKFANTISAICGGIIGYQSQSQAVNHYVEDNVALNVVVISGQSVGGAIIGHRTSDDNLNRLHLSRNYYRNCTINGSVNATNVGLGNPAGDMNGARSVHALTLGTDITATGESVVIGNTTYYASNTTVTLGHNNSTGYLVTYRLNGNALGGNTFTMPNNDNGTVSATLTPITYYVHFDKNNDGASGTMSDQQFTYGQAQNLTANAFTLTGYDFIGWSTTFDGEAEYTDGQSVSNLTTEPNGTVNLYAKWRLKLWQGSGTENDPYIISNIAGLNLLAYTVNNNIDNNDGFAQKYFLQTANLTYNSTTNNYTPIGNNDCKFKGHYDGGGFSISGINVTGSDDYIGVFGYVYYGSVENIVLANTTFTGTNYVGGIVGRTYRGSVNNCKVMGDVTIGTSTSGNYHGGIVGFLTETELTGCLSMATLTDPNNVGSSYGGIAGSNNNGTINNCIYTGGSVTADGNATAISQRNGQSFTFTNNYYYNCTVNGETIGVGIGGDVPDINGAQPAHTITLGENVALAGDQTTYNVSGLTAIGTTVLIHTVGSTSTMLSGAMQTVTLTYTGTMPEGYTLVYNDGADHPTIGNAFMMPDANVTVSISNAFPTIPGMGTEDNPFVISSKEQLDILADMVNIGYSFTNKYFKLGADINYNPNELTNGGNYTAIGFLYSSESNYCFNGTFDGDGHIISGIRINQPVYNPQALFGCVGPNGTVKNVTLADAVITGSSAVGGIAGDNRGTVENCRVINCNITGQTWVGGIAGYNNQCENTENCLVLNTSITYSDTDNFTGGAIIGTQLNCNLNNNYYNSCTVNGVAYNIGCGIGYDFDFNGVFHLTSGDITLHNGALPAYTLTLSPHLTVTPAPNVTFNNIDYYTAGTEVTLGTNPPAYTITSATLTYGGNNHNIASVGGVYSFTMPAADATVLVTLKLDPNAAQFTKGITGYGNDDNPGGWYLIASPVSDPITPTVEYGFLANTYDLYRFNQAGTDGEWENYKVHTEGFVLENGKGYLYANSENVPIAFTGTPYSGNGEVTLVKDDNADLSGWNLVGNPFTMDAYILDNRPFYIMNDEGSEIIAAAGNRNYIEPMEGIFVHADEDGETMTFTTEAPSKGRGQSSEPEQIVINLSTLNSQLSPFIIDRAIVRFDEGRQLPKLQIFENSTKLYIPQGNEEYAIVSAEAQGEIPVCFKAKKNGEYTLTFSIGDHVNIHLIDNLTGVDVDLLTTPTYTFTARNDDYASRFKLVFANENDNQNENEDFAFISNGNIIVTGEGVLQVIDVLGHQLVSRQATSNFRLPTSDFSAGVYVLRLINGENVKTQKIIIK